MSKSLREVAEGILTKKAELLEAATPVPQEPMHSVAKDEADKDEQGEQDLGDRVDEPTDKRKGSATAEKGVKGRATKRPADKNPDNDPMQSLPGKIDGEGQGIEGEGPGKFPARPADASSKQDSMKSLPDDFTTKGKGPKNVDESEETDEEFEFDISEDIEALFNGEELSEEFKEKAATIFEAAVTSRVKQFESQVQEAYEQALEEEITKITEELATNVDDYLNYVVEQWVMENEVAIESGLRTELTEDFITGLRNLFVENYIDVPEEQVDILEDLIEKTQELETKLNEQIEANVQMKRDSDAHLKESIFVSMTKNLPDTQVEKLRGLTENVEFVDEDDFVTKLETIYENYYPTKKGEKPTLDEQGESGSKILAEDLDRPTTKDPMDKYAKYLSKTASV